MKKIIISIGLMTICSVVFGQNADTIVASNGKKFFVGDSILIGLGTMPDGKYKSIYQKPNMATGLVMNYMPNWYNNRKFKITELMTNTPSGKKYLVLKERALIKWIVDYEYAIQLKEIIIK